MNVQGVTVGLLALVLIISCAGNDIDDPTKQQFEAAFQGMYCFFFIQLD